MSSAVNGQQSSRVKRKPPPAFPYSPKYPLPDPSDPFAPLKTLRERAYSTNTALTTPSNPSYGTLPTDPVTDRYLFSASADVRHIQPADVTYPPSTAYIDQRPREGYQSDTLDSRPSRPPRSRVRPSRNSKSYFSDMDVLSASVNQRHRHNQDQHQNEKQYHYRRRSQSVFVLPQPQSYPTTVEDFASQDPDETPHPAADLSTQYIYDDRQSHGYLFGQIGDSERPEDRQPPSAADLHSHFHASTNHSGPTPPMTPDDTLSSSSASARERSVSLSPRSLLRDLPSALPKLPAKAKDEQAPAVVQPEYTNVLHREPSSGIRTAEFPSLLGPSLQDSPPPLPVPPPRTHTRSICVESEPEQEPSYPRRSRIDGTSRRDSLHQRLRRSSLTVRGRKISNPSPLVRARKTSTTSESSLHVARNSIARPTATAAPAPTDAGAGNRFTKFLHPRARKSLSHVSLGVTPLPNVSMGTTIARSANASIASTVVSANTFGAPAAPTPATLELTPNVHHDFVLPPGRRDSCLPSLPVARSPEPELETPTDAEDDDGLAFTAQTSFIPLSPAPPPLPQMSHPRVPVVYREPTPPSPARHSTLPPRVPSPDAPPPFVSPLPPPRSDSPPQFTLSPLPPPTPAPLPLSPPSHTPSDFPTPLPLPLPAPPSLPLVPVVSSWPRQQAAPNGPRNPIESETRQRRREERAREEDVDASSSYLPVAQLRPQVPQPPPARTRADQALSAPISPPSRAASPTPVLSGRPRGHTVSSRPKSPIEHEMKQQRRRDERAREDATDSYFPVTQLRPPSAAHLQDQPRLPFRPTSPTPLSVPPRTRSPPPQATFRAQSPAAQASFRASSPAVQAPLRAPSPPVQATFRAPSPPAQTSFRAQSPPPQPVHRAQSPPPQHAHRAQSPHSQPMFRAQSPPPPAQFRAQSPSVTHSHGHEQGYSSVASRGAMQARGRYPESVASTPAPLPATPSTTFSHPYASTCGRSRGTHRRDHRVQQQPARFDEHALPGAEQLTRAASLYVVAQNGLRVQFGELFRDRKTVVCFIRHFWCPLCQDYMYSISRSVDPDALKRDGVDLVIIGNGSPGMIKAYRQIFHTPFALYTDQSLRLHAALGMTLRTTDAGPDTERGEYVRHGLIGGIAMVVRNALRVGMPVWEKGGDIAQLGGEFVFGPGLTCTYAHRMRTTRAHAPILHVLAAAGVRRVPSPASNDEDAWMAERRRSFARMRAKREKRRAPEQWCGAEEVCELEYGSDTGSASVHGSWGSRAEVEEGTLEEPLPPRREKRGRRGFHVVNPDGRQHARSHRGRAARGWESDAPRLAYSDENFGRTREDSYELTREVLNYSFGQA